MHTCMHTYIHLMCVYMLADAASNTIEARGKKSFFFGKIRGLTPPPPAMVVSVGRAQRAMSCVYSPTNSERH